jgi:hypothetical protein
MQRANLSTCACAVVLAACGSSSGKPNTSASSNSDAPLQLAQCMRAHGVSDFPDPTSGADIAISPSEAQSPAFQSAQQACQHILPNKGAPPRMTASERRAALQFAECMRTQGEPGFPDPSDATSSTSGPILMLHGMQFRPGPGLDPRSPAFRQAAARCGITLPNKRPVGGVASKQP